ncbi:hypothetical protein QWY31_15235 [Cytophagales bacterium LB-30]|uniref:ABC transporter permease n=1 Tax=Shiella aurantiaca TaxID=3058365 RepID=A0ABT8F919_9BACT|nr:hypothetical protein [Shiella aurantiaca]MDN4166864.1 hypothetical protein [Shiella aurantiaca]
MNYLQIIRSDLKIGFRDPLLKIIFFFPLLVIAVAVWIVPQLMVWFPALSSYTLLIMAGAGMQTAIMFGFISGFLHLEEREEFTLQALQVLPLGLDKLLALRMASGSFITLASNMLIFLYSPLVAIDTWKCTILAINSALLAPLISLLIITFSSTRVDGMAKMKIINLVVALPLVSTLFISQWIWLLSPIPSFWVVQSLVNHTHSDIFMAYSTAAVILYILVIGFFAKRLAAKRGNL